MTVLQNRYEIIQTLKQGGMGIVYLAHDKRLEIPVAIKELFYLSQIYNPEQMSVAFKNEARILANLSHPAIPKVTDYFVENEHQYFVMEFVKGIDLHKLIDRQKEYLNYQLVIDWFNQMIDVVDYLHNLPTPIFHRDLKPSNFKLTLRGKIILLDFGISKGLNPNDFKTEKSVNLATVEFAPLEQSLKSSSVIRNSLLSVNRRYTELLQETTTSAATDIFALGATLYRLLTLTLPANAYDRALAVWSGKPDPLLPISSFRPLIPTEIETVVMKSLSILPCQRPNSIKQLKKLMRYTAELSPESSAKGEPCLSKNEIMRRSVPEKQGSQIFLKAYHRKFSEQKPKDLTIFALLNLGTDQAVEYCLDNFPASV